MSLTLHIANDQLRLQDLAHMIGTVAAHAYQTYPAAWEPLDCGHSDLFLQTPSDYRALVH
jgi:hypothetical protein